MGGVVRRVRPEPLDQSRRSFFGNHPLRSFLRSRLGALVVGVVTAYGVAIVALGRPELSLDALVLGRRGVGLTFGVWAIAVLGAMAARADALRRARAALRARPDRAVLAVIVLLAAVLRFAGLERGQKLEFAVDEQRYISEAGRMIEQATLDHENLEHGGLPYYVQALAAITYGIVGPMQGLGGSIAELPPEGYLRYGRYAMAILGTLNVWALAWAVRPLGIARGAGLGASAAAPLVAAGVLALDAAHIGHGRYVHDDLHAALFTTLAWGALLRLRTWKSWCADLGTGMLCGVAVAAKYYDVVLVLPLAAAILLDAAPTKGTPSVRLLRAFGGMALGFFLTSPYTVLHPGQFLAQTKDLHLNTYTVEKGISLLPHLRKAVLHGVGPVFAAVLVVAVVAGAAVARTPALVTASFPVAFLVLLGNFRRLYPRYLLPLQPFLCAAVAVALVVAARAAAKRWPRERARIAHAALGVVLVVGLAAQVPALADELGLRAKLSSAAQAEQWMRSHLPDGATIVSEVAFVGEIEAGRLEIENVPRVVGSRDEIARYDYVVLSEINYERPGLRPRYFELVRDLALVKVFDGTSGGDPDSEQRAQETRIYATRRFPASLALERKQGGLTARIGALPPGSYTLSVTGLSAAAGSGPGTIEIELVEADGSRFEPSEVATPEAATAPFSRSFALTDLETLDVAVKAARDVDLTSAELVLSRQPDPPSAGFRPRRRDQPGP